MTGRPPGRTRDPPIRLYRQVKQKSRPHLNPSSPQRRAVPPGDCTSDAARLGGVAGAAPPSVFRGVGYAASRGRGGAAPPPPVPLAPTTSGVTSRRWARCWRRKGPAATESRQDVDDGDHDAGMDSGEEAGPAAAP